jgi:tetratricopeptide (TPR) repeat protein
MRLTWAPSGVSLTVLLVVTAVSPTRADQITGPRQAGFHLYEAGRFQEAIGDLDKVLERHPRDLEALIRRGHCFLHTDRPEQALRDFDRVIKLSPLNPGGYTDRGIALLMLGRNDEALRSFARATRLWVIPLNGARGLTARHTSAIEAGKATAHSGLAQAHHRMGRNDEAIEEYNRAIAIDPRDPNAFIGRGDAYAALDQQQRALADYDEAIRLGPGYSRAYSSRGILLAAMGQDERALSDYDRAIQVDPTFAHAYKLRGALLSRRGQNDRALVDYDQVIRLLPSDSGAYKDRGGVLVRLGQYQRAIQDLNKAIELDPNRATAYLNRGAAYNSLGQYERAIDDLSKAIKLDPKNAGAHTNCGLAYYMIGQYDLAIEDLSEAVRLAPDNEIVHFNRGNVYARLGFREQALQDYQAANQLNPRLIAAYGGPEKLEEEMARHELAIRARPALRADPKEVARYYERGNALRAQGDWTGAIADFNRVIDCDPKRADAYVARGWSRFCGDTAGAETDARAYLDLKGWCDRLSPYMALLGILGSRRAGNEAEARALLDDAISKTSPGTWPLPVLRYLRREISATALLNEASTETQKTEAHAFIAVDLLQTGNRKGALEHLQWVREHGAHQSIATDLAKATLARVGGTRKSPQRL